MSTLKEQAKSLREGALTVPNLLSAIRIVLVPVFLVLFLQKHYLGAIIAVAASGLSDFLDGKIARKFNQISNLGKMLDPLADKLTTIAIAIAYYFAFHASDDMLLRRFSGVFWFFVVKEVLMVVGAVVILANNYRPAAANWFGKVSTFYYYIVMILLLCVAPVFGAFSRWWSLPSVAIVVMVSLSVVLTLMAFISYLPAAFRQMKKGDSASDLTK